MTSVPTVLGSVELDALGTTYMHQHVFVLTPDVQQSWTDEWDEEAQVADAAQKLSELAAQGVQTIVDPTVVGLGRYLPRIRRVNELVPQLNIIAATGVYTYGDVPNFFRHRGGLVDPMVELFVRDLTEGNHGVVAGMLKCAIDEPGLTAGVERVMRAVGQAHQQTAAPITVHTHPGTQTALEVKRVLCDEEGVDPTAVVLGHSGDSTDVDHLESLAQQGFTLGMDRFGIHVETTFEQRCDTVVELCRRGLADRMVLSQDAACYIDWVAPELMPLMPNWHFQHVLRDVVPALLERGVTQDQVDQMLVGNPRRFFET